MAAVEQQTRSITLSPTHHAEELSRLCEAQSSPKIQKALSLVTIPITFADNPEADDLLFDVLPERFTYNPRMMYGNFTHADHDEIRALYGKQQIARLRRLADIFDSGGKTLFYYYAYPHVWKRLRPPGVNETVAMVIQDKWRRMKLSSRVKWEMHGARVKKLLGDGNIVGLDLLQLHSLDPDVLELHDLTAADIS